MEEFRCSISDIEEMSRRQQLDEDYFNPEMEFIDEDFWVSAITTFYK